MVAEVNGVLQNPALMIQKEVSESRFEDTEKSLTKGQNWRYKKEVNQEYSIKAVLKNIPEEKYTKGKEKYIQTYHEAGNNTSSNQSCQSNNNGNTKSRKPS